MPYLTDDGNYSIMMWPYTPTFWITNHQYWVYPHLSKRKRPEEPACHNTHHITTTPIALNQSAMNALITLPQLGMWPQTIATHTLHWHSTRLYPGVPNTSQYCMVYQWQMSYSVQWQGTPMYTPHLQQCIAVEYTCGSLCRITMYVHSTSSSVAHVCVVMFPLLHVCLHRTMCTILCEALSALLMEQYTHTYLPCSHVEGDQRPQVVQS